MKLSLLKNHKILGVILAVSVLLRLVGILRPLMGNFSSVQVTYAMMARNFRDYSWNLFLPRLDIMMNGELGVRLLDLPIISYFVAMISFVTTLPIDWVGRLWSVLFSVGSIVLLYWIVKRLFSESLALISTFFFAFSPLSIIYGQSFQTDATSIFLLLAAVAGVLRSKDKFAWFLMSSIIFAVALLLRIQFLFLFPLFFYLFFLEPAALGKKIVRISLFSVISVVPLFLWNIFIYIYLVQNLDTVIMSIFHQLQTGTYISYAPWSQFFMTQFANHFFNLVLNPIGAALCLLGIISLPSVRNERITYLWFSLVLITFCFLTKKAIDMNYYLLGIVPPASIFAAKAVTHWRAGQKERVGSLKKWPLIFGVVIYLGISLRYAAGPAYVTPADDRSVIEAARFVKEHTTKDDLIIASNGTNSNLLYYTERKGWTFPILGRKPNASGYEFFTIAGRPLSADKLEYLISQKNSVQALEYYKKKGAKYFVCSRPDELEAEPQFKRYMDQHHLPLSRSPRFIFYKLR